ncbi:MAG: Ig-like domain-containing protein [Eubacteriaceae bacterium]|nr:Ig-like domain-containing protein [Eubacteriaceae bacterium]
MLPKGTYNELTASVSPSNATDKVVSWSSSNTAVVTVSSGGVVMGKSAGTATITAAAGGRSARCTVTMPSAVAYATVNRVVNYKYSSVITPFTNTMNCVGLRVRR